MLYIFIALYAVFDLHTIYYNVVDQVPKITVKMTDIIEILTIIIKNIA